MTTQLEHPMDWIEMTILSNMIVNREKCRQALTTLKASDFRNGAHAIIFTALQRMEESSNAIRFLGLLDYLQKHSLMIKAGGRDYLKLVYLYSPECELSNFIGSLKGLGQIN